MPFKKRFTFHHSDKGKIEIIPHFEETQKLNLEHGFWWYEQRATTFQTKEEKTFAKNARKWNNICKRNRGPQDNGSSTPVVAMVER